jgi:hypothetical protein
MTPRPEVYHRADAELGEGDPGLRRLLITTARHGLSEAELPRATAGGHA